MSHSLTEAWVRYCAGELSQDTFVAALVGADAVLEADDLATVFHGQERIEELEQENVALRAEVRETIREAREEIRQAEHDARMERRNDW